MFTTAGLEEELGTAAIRGDIPMDEFTNNGDTIMKLFWNLFLLRRRESVLRGAGTTAAS